MLRDHLRSNIIGYVAVFIALSGTALANHPDGADTISATDIINGEVRTHEISNNNGVRSLDVRDDTLEEGGLAAVDLAPDSVAGSEIADGAAGSSEIADGAVGTLEIGASEVLSADIAANGVSAADIADNAVNRAQLGDNAVGGPEIGSNAVGSSELTESSVRGEEIDSEAVESGDIAFDAVGKSELDSNAVGADSIVELHEHTGELGSVTDGVAHDGAYGADTVTVTCPTTEKLVSWSLDWTDNNDHNETMIANVPTIDRSGDDSVTITGAFDGGGGEANPARFEAVTTCLGP